jgi:hypothetical protein
MGTSISVYGTEKDCAAPNSYIGSLGLVLVPPSLERELERRHATHPAGLKVERAKAGRM